jgi:mRNA-degrading endonuclease RelE of RelBE toxin-antitoxin system
VDEEKFTVYIHPRIEKDLDKIPDHVRNKFRGLIEALKFWAVPKFFDIVKLKGTGSLDAFRVRFGDYRVIYVVDWDRREIKVLRLERRGKSYK